MNDELRAVKFLIDIIHTDLTELAEAVRLYGENDFRRGAAARLCRMPGSAAAVPRLPLRRT